MKISESWLREWVSPELSTQELADQITMAGLEVDAIEPVGGDISGVVVGEIVSIEQHPDADKLRVCQVAGNGAETVQVVCGAPNARAGIKIPFATVGAVLPGNFKIKKAKLRGVESFGMLCAQTELQLGDDDDGLWELADDAPVGTALTDYLKLDDQCIEVDLTPNRSDCLSMKGIAREVGVLNKLAVTEPAIDAVNSEIDDTLSIKLTVKEDCPRYVGRVIRGVDLKKPTPLWMQERLRRAGIGSKDIAVDTTNYVLLELGQPMHAFDLAKVDGGINVRHAADKEPLALLNGQTVELTAGTLVIADDAKALGIAGVMGGADSAVSETTVDIFLESAFFVPSAIAGRARSYGLHTDSSHRFERGVDYKLQEVAMERATALITAVAGGKVGPLSVVEESHELTAARSVVLRKARIETGLGFAIPDAEVMDIMTRLGLKELSSDSEGWTYEVPSYRFDISIEEDLLEELARVYGYNRLPTRSLSMPMPLPASNESDLSLSAIQSHLVARGYQEAVCYSFVEPSLQQLLDPQTSAVPLQNPISSDMAVMRTSLWQGLVTALQNNLKRQQGRVRLFETGLRFVVSGDESQEVPGVTQEPMVAGLIYGSREPEGWAGDVSQVDFYDLKGDVESLLSLTGYESDFTFEAGKHPALHPGQTAEVKINGESIGFMGALHPQIQKQLDIPQKAYMFEFTQAGIKQKRLPSFSPLSRFPEVRRDIAVLVDQTLAVSSLLATVKESAGELLTNLKVFDVYVGKGIDSHRKSVALSLTFQHLSRTLTDDEITAAVDSVVKNLKDKVNAELR